MNSFYYVFTTLLEEAVPINLKYSKYGTLSVDVKSIYHWQRKSLCLRLIKYYSFVISIYIADKNAPLLSTR